MNVQIAQMLISILTLLMAYGIAVTLAGSFRAWVAYKFGDDTAESLGFLSLNPLVHIDPIGLIILFIFNWAWGRYIPINTFKIHGPLRTVRIIFAYASDKLVYFVMALSATLFLYFSLGSSAIFMIIKGEFSQAVFAQAFPEASSLAISLGFVAITVVFLSVLLIVLSFFLGTLRLIVRGALYKFPEYRQHELPLLLAIILVPEFLYSLKIIPVNPFSYLFHYLFIFVIKILIFFSALLINLFGA